MNIIVLDIETTGDNYSIDEICQMSYFILNENLHIIKAKNFFFKVDYVHFKSSKSKLNINELKSLSNNKSFRDNCEEIFNDLNENLIVCHNIEHDLNFINSEFLRCGIKNFKYNEFCTMKYYTNELKIKHDKYGYKYPKLEEIMPYLNIKRGDIVGLCDYFFNEKDINLHDSRFDTSILYYIVKNTNEIGNVINKIKANNDVEINYENNKESSYNKIDTKQDSLKIKECKTSNVPKNSIINILFDLFSFNKRIGRKEYLYRLIFSMMSFASISVCLEALYYYNGYDAYVYNADSLYYAIKTIGFVLPIYLYWLLISTSVKRVHDINQKGIFLLTLIIPIINIVTWFKLFFKKGNQAENKFGMPRISDRSSNQTKRVLIIGYIISIIALMLCSSYVEDIKSTNIEKAIELVIDNTSVFGPYTSVEEEIDNRISEIKEELIFDEIREFGWDAIHIEGSNYLVSYDFDVDNYDDNGYNCFPFEVNIYSGYVKDLKGYNLKEQYKDILGEYKNEFDPSWY